MALPRLIFVTGKGGTGKSTVAAALAVAMAREHPTTLADLDGRQSAARVLGHHPIDASAEQLDSGSFTNFILDGALELVALTPRAELAAFIHRIVPLRAISRRMLRSRTFGYVTAALPGLEAFLMIERLRLIAGRAALEDRFAVVDAPATGHALELLAVAQTIDELAPVGTLNRLARAVKEFLADPYRFGVVLTVLPEELALREALEAAETLRAKLGIGSVSTILNGVAPALFTPGEIEKLAPLGGHRQLAERRRAAADFAVHARRELKRAGLSVVELPMQFAATLGGDEIETLSAQLAVGLLAGAGSVAR
jgi:arsenite/tail-anchored protein-transporting ATPase